MNFSPNPKSFIFFLLFFCVKVFAQPFPPAEDTSKMAMVLIKTKEGNIKIRLSNLTPLHRDNFLKLANAHYYDSLLFHRVINEFMIQGGDPYSKHAKQFVVLGDSDIHYTVPAEINARLFHKRGMLCAARDGDDVNPKRASSAAQFYITQGRGKLTDRDLLLYEYRINKKLRQQLKDSILSLAANKDLAENYALYKKNKLSDSLLVIDKKLDRLISPLYEARPHYIFSAEQRDAYKKVGGTPHLDGAYTVYGEVVEGIEVVDRIAAANTDTHDRPLEDIRMYVAVLRMPKD